MPPPRGFASPATSPPAAPAPGALKPRAQNAEGVRGFFDLLRSIPLVGDKNAARLHERNAVFGEGIQPRYRARAADIEFFAVSRQAREFLGAAVDDARVQPQLGNRPLQKRALFSDRFDEYERKIVPPDHQRNGRKSPARPHFQAFRTLRKIFFSRKAVEKMFNIAFFPPRDAGQVDFLVVFGKQGVKRGKFFSRFAPADSRKIVRHVRIIAYAAVKIHSYSIYFCFGFVVRCVYKCG